MYLICITSLLETTLLFPYHETLTLIQKFSWLLYCYVSCKMYCVPEKFVFFLKNADRECQHDQLLSLLSSSLASQDHQLILFSSMFLQRLLVATSWKQLLKFRQLVSYDCCTVYGLITVLGVACFLLLLLLLFLIHSVVVSCFMLVTDCLQFFLFPVCVTRHTMEAQMEGFFWLGFWRGCTWNKNIE